MRSSIRFLSGVVVALVAGVASLNASTVTYNFGQVSGGTSPGGPPPWLQAVFTDNGMPSDTVQLTVSAANLVGSEFVSCLYFNLNPGMNPKALNFSLSGSNPSIQTGMNSFKAGPDGKYDIVLDFSTVSGSQFVNGDSLTVDISGISGLTASDFNYLSTAGGGSGAFSSAAHIQSINPGDVSGWINPTSTFFSLDTRQPAVPDGSETILLLGASLLAIGFVSRSIRFSPARISVKR